MTGLEDHHPLALPDEAVTAELAHRGQRRGAFRSDQQPLAAGAQALHLGDLALRDRHRSPL